MITPTDHAVERARERLGWKPDTLARMLPKIEASGVPLGDTRGKLRRYLDKKRSASDNGRGSLLVFSDHVFIVRGGALITVLDLPKEFHRAARDAAKRKP